MSNGIQLKVSLICYLDSNPWVGRLQVLRGRKEVRTGDWYGLCSLVTHPVMNCARISLESKHKSVQATLKAPWWTGLWCHLNLTEYEGHKPLEAFCVNIPQITLRFVFPVSVQCFLCSVKAYATQKALSFLPNWLNWIIGLINIWKDVDFVRERRSK